MPVQPCSIHLSFLVRNFPIVSFGIDIFETTIICLFFVLTECLFVSIFICMKQISLICELNFILHLTGLSNIKIAIFFVCFFRQ
jgi:hypothetical protein